MHRNTILGSLLLAAVMVATIPITVHAQIGTFLGKNATTWQEELAKPDAKTRRNAAFALGKLGPWAVGVLPKLVSVFENDADPKVKDAAAYAIGEICKANGTNSLSAAGQIEAAMTKALLDAKADPMVKRSAAYAIGCLGTKAINALSALDRALKEEDPAIRQNAAWALGEIGESGVVSLVKAMSDRDPYVIRDAANSLGKIGPSLEGKPDRVTVLGALVPKMNHPDTEVKKAVVQALVKVVEPTDGAVSAPLQALLTDPKENPEIQFNAAVALANIGGDKATVAVTFLQNVLEKGDLDRQRQAAAVIGNIGKPALSAVPALKLALKSPDLILRKNAATSLGGIGAPISPAHPSNKGKAADPERFKITAAVPDLIDLLSNPGESNDVREAAAISLKEIGPCEQMETARATDVLISTVANKSNSSKLRAVTLWPLRFHSGINKLDKLFGTLNEIVEKEPISDATKMLRYDAAYILSRYKKAEVSNRVLDTVLEFLKDKEVFIATGTSGSSTGVGEGSTGTSGTKILKGDDGRIIAVQALYYIADEKNGGSKKKVLDRNDVVQELQALNKASMDPQIRKLTPPLLDYLNVAK